MEFARSERATLGVEWELAIVDPNSRELVPRAADVIDRVGDPRVKGEFFTNTVELVSGVHTSSDAAIGEMRELRDAVLAAGDELGVAFIGSGTHPFSKWREQTVSDAARYQRLVRDVGPWAERLVIFGVHTHVGLDAPATQIPAALRMLVERLPMLLALSASSPFWQGEDSGCASQRTMLFQQLPTAGFPPLVDTWDEWSRVENDLVRVGAAAAASELRWDVRPSPAFGTIESRIPDGSPSLTDLSAITALTHCLLVERFNELDRGVSATRLSPWLLRENRWRATRSGMDAVLIVDDEGATAPVRELLADAVERLRPLADTIGAAAGLDAVERVVERGGSAALQRDVAAAGMPAVVDHLVAELRS